MGIEIERKFLVNKQKWSQVEKEQRSLFRQGYMVSDPEKTIRVRLTDTAGYLTIKGRSVGVVQPEYEYAIPLEDAQQLLEKFCMSEISKIRNFIIHDGKLWEVDEFLGENEGLIVAEIELQAEDEAFSLPDWIDKEVTHEKKYSNSNLSVNPYKNWSTH